MHLATREPYLSIKIHEKSIIANHKLTIRKIKMSHFANYQENHINDNAIKCICANSHAALIRQSLFVKVGKIDVIFNYRIFSQEKN
jgi:hypothetical protein